jgi:N-acetylneuraminic acid mutarotase
MPTAISGSDFALIGLGISQVDSLNTASDFSRYTSSTDTWSEAPDCGSEVILGAGFYEDGKAYLIGDKPAAGSAADHDNRLYRLNPTTNSWLELARIGNTTDWFTFATTFMQKAIAVSTANGASVLTSMNLSTGELSRHGTLPVPYSPGGTAFIFRLNNRLYLGDLMQKKIWTCKLG